MSQTIEDVVKEEPSFFAKEFAEDASRLADLPDGSVPIIAEWLSSMKDHLVLNEAEAWVEASRRSSLSIDELQRLLRPIALLANISTEHEIQSSELIDYLIEAGPLGNVANHQKLQKVLSSLTAPLAKLAKLADEVTSPVLPLFYIKNVRTCCIVVSEFKEDIDLKSFNLADYHPHVKKLHARTTLELSLDGLKKERVGIVLTPDSLKNLRNAIDAAEAEMAATEAHLDKGR